MTTLSHGRQAHARTSTVQQHAVPAMKLSRRTHPQQYQLPFLSQTLTACTHQHARRLTAWASSSVDPLVATSDGVYRQGQPFVIHSPQELERFTKGPNNMDKLTVLMAKSSHCRPCKKFAATYISLAQLFSDCHLLVVVGDENPVTRKMMVDMKVKVTPTFFLYRNGKCVTQLTGTGRGQLRKAIIDQLLPHEAGKDAPPSSIEATASDMEQTYDDE